MTSQRTSTIEVASHAGRIGFRPFRISILAALVGVTAGVVAWALYSLIALVSNAVFHGRTSLEIIDVTVNRFGLWIIVVPAIGGLLIGLLARFGSEKIRGHGIPEAMEAVLFNRSRIAPRLALLKPLSAAIAIGTGGPFGAEGPIIQTGGALGSIIGQLIGMTAAERKVLLACGAAAGMAATFSTPIAAVILAIELLLFEFKSRSFIPLVIATTVATAVHFALMGREPMIALGAIDFAIPSALPAYVVLGVLCGIVAVAFSRALYFVEDLFERLPINPMWWPAIGGLGLGLIGLAMPRVLGVGYGTISEILGGGMPLKLLALIIVFKSLALLVSLGSGTSGGLLAPLFMIGAAFGAAFANVVNILVPTAHLSPAAFALVAMAAVFGAASRATFTFIIFAFEITRDYDAILPLMLSAVIADGIGLLLMRNSIMTEKLARRGLRVHGEYETDVLEQATVASVMDRAVPTVPPSMSVRALAERIGAHDPAYAGHHGFPIVDDGALVGIITYGDILASLEENGSEPLTVADVGSSNLVVAYPDQSLHEAVAAMIHRDIGRLPVVERGNDRQLVGYLGRDAALRARAGRFDEEHARESATLRLGRRRKGGPADAAVR
jgi:chloride channel protein, CIC family